MNEKDKNNFKLALLGSLTLGLTPFYPEPHIVGKIRWIAGGAIGMQLMDYFDLIMHGIPWLFLFYYAVVYIKTLLVKSKTNYDDITKYN